VCRASRAVQKSLPSGVLAAVLQALQQPPRLGARGPLFAEHAALPEGHPRRERLRAELIAGYLPVARNIARKYGYRGEPPQDLEQVASVPKRGG
jgi:hypothetical protein